MTLRTMEFERGSGEWTIALPGDRFIDFSPEPPGLQVFFDEGFDRPTAERIAAEISQNLQEISGLEQEVIWM